MAAILYLLGYYHDLAPDYVLDLLVPYEPLCGFRCWGGGLLTPTKGGQRPLKGPEGLE